MPTNIYGVFIDLCIAAQELNPVLFPETGAALKKFILVFKKELDTFEALNRI